MIFLCYMTSREHEETERDTGGVGQDMSMPLKLFLVSGSFVCRDVRTNYSLDLRFLVKKQISMIMADLSWKHINIFRGIQEVSAFRGIQEVSAPRVRKELINHNLYLFA